jgi:hypothetical protein
MNDKAMCERNIAGSSATAREEGLKVGWSGEWV